MTWSDALLKECVKGEEEIEVPWFKSGIPVLRALTTEQMIVNCGTIFQLLHSRTKVTGVSVDEQENIDNAYNCACSEAKLQAIVHRSKIRG